MISITRLVTAAAAVFALATLCPAQERVKPTDLGMGAEFKGKKIEMSWGAAPSILQQTTCNRSGLCVIRK